MSSQQPNPIAPYIRFADWCLNFDSLSEEAKHTVELLLKIAGTSDYYEAEQSLTNLTSLHLCDNQILHLTPLQSLTNLTVLHLSNNQILDLTPLQSLTNLTCLFLYDNQISDLTPLQSLTDLTWLSLLNNQISDLTPLQSLTDLTYLSLSNNQISDLTPLQSLTDLTHLFLENNQISDLTPLQSLTNLTGLNLYNNQISDLTHLQSLTDLTHLSLGNNQISDLKPLQFLTDLTSMSLDYNQISDLTPLQSLTNLTSMSLDYNQISDLTPLQSLTNLTYLHLSNNQISDLTPLQYLNNLTDMELEKNQISDLTTLQSLWKAIANSTGQVDRTRAAAAIEFAYAAIGKSCPKIIFCSSPHSAITKLKNLKYPTKRREFFSLFPEQITLPDRAFELIILYNSSYSSQIGWEGQLAQELVRDFWDDSEYSASMVTGSSLLDKICMAEFYVSLIRIALNPDAQKALECLKQLFVECGWIFAFEDVCYACSRPTKLSLDSEYRLHAEGESALEFSDGYKLYSYHGVTLPEKYGQVHPNQWEATWILEEENAELRRVLIQGIGYARICSELQAIDLDAWQEYTLLRIDYDIDGFAPQEKEPIYLLKMTCPSTGFIHALRVPPDIQSAREAIRWVNWDVDYEEFSVQT